MKTHLACGALILFYMAWNGDGVFADSITMINGDVIDCYVISQTNDVVRVQVSNSKQKMEFPKKLVKSVQIDEADHKMDRVNAVLERKQRGEISESDTIRQLGELGDRNGIPTVEKYLYGTDKENRSSIR